MGVEEGDGDDGGGECSGEEAEEDAQGKGEYIEVSSEEVREAEGGEREAGKMKEKRTDEAALVAE
jgi:hypothetical protein